MHYISSHSFSFCRQTIESNTESSIIDLCTNGHTNIFKGNVLIIYELSCARNTNSLVKAQLVHAGLIDQNKQMNVFVTIANTLIECFMPYFSKGSSVSITNFMLNQKTIFYLGDVDVCIHLTTKSIIENIPTHWHARRLALNYTIQDLHLSTNEYGINSLVALVTHFQQINGQYHFKIKDGETNDDTATVRWMPLSTFFCSHFLALSMFGY